MVAFMESNSIEIIAAFVLYLGLMMGIGLLYYCRTSTASDYLLGNRGLHRFVAAISAEASDMSGWLLIGLPGLAYLAGMQAGWVALGLVLGTWANWKYVAPRLRIYTERAGDAITLPDFFKNRFSDRSHLLGGVCAVFILLFFLIYTSAQFVAGGKLFTTVFGIDYVTALLISSLIVVAYTFIGGFRAVCITDTVQGILMFLAILIVPLAALAALGGPLPVIDTLRGFDPSFLNPFTNPDGTPLTLIAIVSLIAWGLGYFGQPHILVRFMAIRDPAEIKQARSIAMVWVIISLAAAIAIGIVGKAFVAAPLTGPDAETIFMVMTGDLFFSFLAGVILCGILAAIMSTASSILLVCASAVSKDLYHSFVRPASSDRELVWVSRVSVLIVAAAAILLGLNPDSFVFLIVAYAWAGFGAAFGPALLMALFWKRTTLQGVLAGILIGGITVIVWKQLLATPFGLYEIVPGFILSLATVWIVSLMTPAPDAATGEVFEQVKEATEKIA
jgi:sodium/proline symporter